MPVKNSYAGLWKCGPNASRFRTNWPLGQKRWASSFLRKSPMADEVTSTGLTWLCDRAAAQGRAIKSLHLCGRAPGVFKIEAE